MQVSPPINSFLSIILSLAPEPIDPSCEVKPDNAADLGSILSPLKACAIKLESPALAPMLPKNLVPANGPPADAKAAGPNIPAAIGSKGDLANFLTPLKTFFWCSGY